MLVYGINFSEQIEQHRKVIENTGGAGAVALVGVANGINIVNVAASLALAPVTFGASLALGAASTVAAIGATSDLLAEDGDMEQWMSSNNGKSSLNLKNEIEETNNLLDQKQDWETEHYERYYCQEVPAKENCVIM